MAGNGGQRPAQTYDVDWNQPPGKLPGAPTPSIGSINGPRYPGTPGLPGINPLVERAKMFEEGNLDKGNLEKLYNTDMAGRMSPDSINASMTEGMNTFFQNPNVAAARGMTEQAMGQFGQGYQDQIRQMAGGQGAVMGQMRNMAMGQDSVVNRTAQAQRQAQARQMAMNTAAAGGQGNPLAMRNMAMAQGQMGQGMAAQVAAARAQERQQAQQNYLNARMGAANAAAGMDAQAFDNALRYGQQTGDFAGAGAGQAGQATEMGGNYYTTARGDKADPFR